MTAYTFDQVYTSVALNTTLAVSDGRPAPPEGPTLRWRLWKSANFTGPLKEKIAGTPRKLRIEAVNAAGLIVSYVISDGMGHTFNT